MTDLFGSYQVGLGLITELAGTRAHLVPIDLHGNLLDELFEHLVCQVREQMLYLPEVQSVIVLLQKSNDVSFGMLLDMLLIRPRLWIVNRQEWLNLSHRIYVLNFAKDHLLLTFLILEEGAKEICVLWFVVEQWSSIQLIAENCNALELALIDVTKKEFVFGIWWFQDLQTVWADVFYLLIFRLG